VALWSMRSEKKPVTEPATFQDFGLAPFGSPRCAHCGNPTGLRQFKYRDGSIHVVHLACAKPYFAAMDVPPVVGEKIEAPTPEASSP
jgi:recombinational DNA repair protein (RecF pathway)